MSCTGGVVSFKHLNTSIKYFVRYYDKLRTSKSVFILVHFLAMAYKKDSLLFTAVMPYRIIPNS